MDQIRKIPRKEIPGSVHVQVNGESVGRADLYLDGSLWDKLQDGEMIRLGVNGKSCYCRFTGAGPVSDDLIWVSIYNGHEFERCIGVHRDNFSITRLRALV